MKNDYLTRLRDGEQLTLGNQLAMVAQLSLPAIMAQISSIVMQYIDASMVGRLGSEQSASIGLVASSTWLFGGLCSAVYAGFTVLAAQSIGAKDEKNARQLMKESLCVSFLFALFMGTLGAVLSPVWPKWLGGGADIVQDASRYFLIYALFLPVVHLSNSAGAMLQASGNMKTPSVLHVLMCLLDVVFNLLLIFPESHVLGFRIPGANLGVTGAALGTALAQAVVMVLMLFALLVRSPLLHLRKGEGLHFKKQHLTSSIRISVPVALESMVMSGAQVLSTGIVAPLGTVSIAANSFAVTAESFCDMPGYGIGSASSTIIGQSIGAKRHDLTKKLGWINIILGMAVMTVTGALMYLLAPVMIGLLSPDPAVVALGTKILRIEAFAEPFYAASIVASGIFRGAGDTLKPGLLNLCSMWLVRLPLAALLAPRIGLTGVWIAMALELTARGTLFLIRMVRGKWMKKVIL